MKRFCLLVFILAAGVISASEQLTFTSLDFPEGTLTTARGINNHGEIVGAYGVVPPRHALLINGGKFLQLAELFSGYGFSEAWKINDGGDVVGLYAGNDGFSHGFLLRKSVLTTLDFPGASDTYATGINESGAVVGYWDILDSNGNTLVFHGFTWNKGTFTQLDFSSSGDTSAMGINARGDIVGAWDAGITSTTGHGFVLSKGQFISFDVPFAGATITQANDINAKGSIVGEWVDASGGIHGFLVEGAKFTSIDYPGAAITSVWGINSAGQIVGNHFDTVNSTSRGYIAQPEKKGKP